ncbi:MAG: PadR family transcriptional regulator [Rhizobiaceae bacterium]|nr:PadR family transcriptional regulator [Rhizobiaceae bacterium]
MFGHRHCEGSAWHMAGGRGFGGRGGRIGGGPFGGHRGGPLGGRGKRLFDGGALRLVVLGLIAEEPRHGYDIIKALESRFQGAYSPSPGAIYPMLQMLEEADLVRSDADGNKRLYSITDEGRAFLEENARELERINAQIDEISAASDGATLGHELRALKFTLFSRMREGSLEADKARKALEILRRARQEIDNL